MPSACWRTTSSCSSSPAIPRAALRSRRFSPGSIFRSSASFDPERLRAYGPPEAAESEFWQRPEQLHQARTSAQFTQKTKPSRCSPSRPPSSYPSPRKAGSPAKFPASRRAKYLEPLAEVDVDTIVLGCTHYPLLNETIHDVAADLLGHEVVVVDSAEATAARLVELQGSGSPVPAPDGDLRILVTDLPGQFASSASRFLGKGVDGLDIEAIDL